MNHSKLPSSKFGKVEEKLNTNPLFPPAVPAAGRAMPDPKLNVGSVGGFDLSSAIVLKLDMSPFSFLCSS